MAAFNKFNQFVADLANGVHNLGSNNVNVMLTDVSPVATNTIKANITEIASGNGYSTGGTTATLVSSSQTSGLYKLILNNVTFTASGGAIAQFRYVVLYNATVSGGPLIGWFDYGSEINVTNSSTFTVTFDATNGAIELQ